MNCDYDDIRDKLGEPLWWDEAAVPRYCDFDPDETHDIYANEAALVLIKCQFCRHEFKVCFSYNLYSFIENPNLPTLAAAIESDALHYGDPPNAGCCPAGPTASSVAVGVLQYWRKNDNYLWERVLKYEVALREKPSKE